MVIKGFASLSHHGSWSNRIEAEHLKELFDPCLLDTSLFVANLYLMFME